MKNTATVIVFVIVFLATSTAHAIRIKDLASFEGVRDNQLIGYGLVVGLNGSGDSDQARIQTLSVVNMLERMGITTSVNDIKIKNVAAVMVTATLPPLPNRETAWMFWFHPWGCQEHCRRNTIDGPTERC